MYRRSSSLNRGPVVCPAVTDADAIIDQPDPDLETDELSEDELSEIEEAEPNAEPVSYTGTDFDVEGLVRRLNRGDIVVPSFGHDDAT